MSELLAEILADPAARTILETFIKEAALEVVHLVFSRREQDPVYSSHLDAAMAAKKAATTPEALLAAQNRIRALMSGQ